MDYEIKILLNRLIEAIDSPDEWTIALTIANTIAVIGIAIVQIRMQKRQTKLQEHDMYKKMYSLIYSIHEIGGSVICNLSIVLKNYCCGYDKEFCIKYLEKKQKEIDDLIQKLYDHKIDLELKTKIKYKEFVSYESYLMIASGLINDFVYFLKNKMIKSLDIDENQTFNDEEFIDYILINIEESKRLKFKQQINLYMTYKSRIAGYNILSSLKEHCIL